MKSEVNHTTFRNEKLFCTHCDGELSLVYPISITILERQAPCL